MQFLRNRYAITFIIVLVWIIFFDQASISKWIKQKSDNNKIKKQIELIDKRATEIEEQAKVFKNNKDSIEKYARENYYMKKDNEVIYIFE